MLARIVAASVRRRVLVLLASGVVLAVATRAAMDARLDVFPEFAAAEVVVQVEAPGLGAEEIDRMVTSPLERALYGTPELATIRSSSIVGLGVLTLIFQEDTPVERAQRLVRERLATLTQQLPAGVGAPEVMPPAPAIGVVARFALVPAAPSEASLRALREAADWQVRPRLLATPGVSHVVVIGGLLRELQVRARAASLYGAGLTLDDLERAVAAASSIAAAGRIDRAGQSLVVVGDAAVRAPADVAAAAVPKDGQAQAVTVGQLADVGFGDAPSQGASLCNGIPCVVVNVYRQPGRDARRVAHAVEETMTALRPDLPEGTRLEVIFRQADFIDRAVGNLLHAIGIGALLVVLVIVGFLWSWRAAAVSLVAIPLSILAAVFVLDRFGLGIDAMTLGGLAIAVGEVVDDAIIDVENIARRLRQRRGEVEPGGGPAFERIVVDASVEVRHAVVHATFVVLLVTAPIFALGGLEGRLFHPLGLAYVLSIAASLVVAIVVTPALAAMWLPRAGALAEPPLSRRLEPLFRRLLGRVVAHPRAVSAGALALVAGAALVVPFLAGEFLPAFNEGHVLLVCYGLPGTALDETVRAAGRVDRALRPGLLANTYARAGRGELDEEVFGPHFMEIDADLPRGTHLGDMEPKLRAALARFPGWDFHVEQFISERIEEVVTGEHAPIVVKVWGEDLEAMRRVAGRARDELRRIPGLSEVSAEASGATPRLAAHVRRDALARYGVSAADVTRRLEAAVRGVPLGELREGERAFGVYLRYAGADGDPSALGDLLVDTPSGARVTLSALADLVVEDRPAAIKREGGRRRLVVTAEVEGGDVAGATAEVERRLHASLAPPPGVGVTIEGSARERRAALASVALWGGLAVLGILTALWIAFASLRDALLVMVNLPLALVGGVAGVLLGGGVVSIASVVGFVTLLGVATRNGIMLITHYHHLQRIDALPFDRELILRGAADRLAPILMTALAAGLALAPLAFGADLPGRELERPMAQVIVGGLISSTILNLLVVPALYLRWGRPLPAAPEIHP